MNWIDLAVIGIVLLSGLLGYLRGLIREVLGLAAWVGAAIAASALFQFAQVPARRLIHDPEWADPAAFLGIFVIMLLLFTIVAGLIGRMSRRSLIGPADRGLGLFYGVARGVFVLILAYVLVGIAMPPETWPPELATARTVPAIGRGAAWVMAQVPAEYRAYVDHARTSLIPEGGLQSSPGGATGLGELGPDGLPLGAEPTITPIGPAGGLPRASRPFGHPFGVQPLPPGGGHAAMPNG